MKRAHPDRRAALFALLLLVTAALTQDRPTPQTHPQVCLVVSGLRVDEDPDHPVLDPAVAEGAEVTLVGPDGASQTKATLPLERGERTWYTADFFVAFDTTYELRLKFADGQTITMADYRVDSEWTKVPIFTFNSTTGTTSPAAVLRSETDAATQRGCYVWALWPADNYVKVGGRQLAR